LGKKTRILVRLDIWLKQMAAQSNKQKRDNIIECSFLWTKSRL